MQKQSTWTWSRQPNPGGHSFLGKAAELVERRFGVKTQQHINPVTGTVGATETEILLNNPDRVAVLIINLSPNEVNVGFDAPVSTTRGIKLGPGGGSLSLTIDEDFELVSSRVIAVAAVAGSAIYIVEEEAA